MLIARIYGLLWLLLTAVAFNTYLTDSFTYGTTMILGFSASILAGAGLLVVYPALLTERVSSWRRTPEKIKAQEFIVKGSNKFSAQQADAVLNRKFHSKLREIKPTRSV